ncbi:unnamed protein product [Cuscuta europaea]|uniref:Uncharacterized protein n=1 Tax=Cuscuta europaea TaxID=41803 RepID=A0A9P1E161_CUSEU|nr:unnamed protein product [Cuscuta europaea]
MKAQNEENHSRVEASIGNLHSQFTKLDLRFEEQNMKLNQRIDTIEQYTKTSIRNLEVQMGQLAQKVSSREQEAIAEIPSYAKFLKGFISNKKRLEEFTNVALTEECSVIIQNKLPSKLKDPGSFTISCSIEKIGEVRQLSCLSRCKC